MHVSLAMMVGATSVFVPVDSDLRPMHLVSQTEQMRSLPIASPGTSSLRSVVWGLGENPAGAIIF